MSTKKTKNNKRIVRCYNCSYYKPKSKTSGYCEDLKEKVDAVDFCSENALDRKGNPIKEAKING